MQTITPYLLYEDVDAALGFLTKAFGFKEVLRYAGEEGYVNHAEAHLDDGAIYLGDPGPDYQSPKRSGHIGSQVYVYVDDVDAHYERARAAGAEIVQEPHEPGYGDRRYDAKDPEGHLWSFATRVQDLAPEDWGATSPTAASAS
jgi:uncharacterized glyoxalase superfamily protein PhnB